MKKRIIWITTGIILVIAIGALSYNKYFRNKKEVYYWRTSHVEKGEVNLIVTATGLVSADTTVAIGTQVSGILSKLYVDFNSRVKKGQIIAQIDTTILHANRVDAGAALDRAKTQLEEYKREYERQKGLFENKVISQADYDLSLTNYQSAKSNLTSMKAQLERAVINLHYATIRSPINGVVISRNLDEGQTVIASFNTPTLFTIVNDLKKMQVQANVSEADIGEVKMDQDVDFTVDAYPADVFTGHVQQIRLQPVTVQNVVNYVVIIDAANPELKLMPGLTANINIKVTQKKDVLKVPSNALSFTPPDEYLNGNLLISDSVKSNLHDRTESAAQKTMTKKEPISYLWVLNGSELSPVKVKKGISDGVFTEVEGNLKVGQEVVTGVNHSATPAKEEKTQNPFMPKFPSKNKKE